MDSVSEFLLRLKIAPIYSKTQFMEIILIF